MNDLNLYSVNWQDGMLLNQKHLKEQERFFEELVRWYASGVGDNYGLVKRSESGKPALSLSASVSGSRLIVEISRCQAITPDGSYIEIGESLGEVIRAEIDITESQVPVFVGINSQSKKLIGDPDPSEDIPRIPYQIKDYQVSLGEPPNLPVGQYIQIARLSLSGSEANQAPDYFPPCLSLNADERLAAIAVDYRNRLENLLALSTRAYMGVSTRGALSGASTSLQQAFKETVFGFVSHLASTLDDFVVGRNAPHPRFMVIHFKKLFRILSSLLNLHPGLKDYLNERYFSKELSTDIGRYLASVDACLLAEYDHKDLAGHVRMIDDILGAFRGMLAFLAQTKPEELGEQAIATESLTYLGKTYKNINYSSCRLEQVGELCYLIVVLAEPGPIADVVTLIDKKLFADSEWRSMQVRLGVNEARGLGETDPVDVDVTTFGNKVALHPRDMLKSSSVRQATMIFRGTSDPKKFANLGKMDLILYIMS